MGLINDLNIDKINNMDQIGKIYKNNKIGYVYIYIYDRQDILNR